MSYYEISINEHHRVFVLNIKGINRNNNDGDIKHLTKKKQWRRQRENDQMATYLVFLSSS